MSMEKNLAGMSVYYRSDAAFHDMSDITGILYAVHCRTFREKTENKNRSYGDVDETYLGIGLLALQRMDTLRFAIDFSTMTEDEAEKKLAAGELAAYVDISGKFCRGV